MQYTPPPHVTQHWQLSKPRASGRRGIVVSQAKGAAEAGVAVLDAGGNAIDAAVATALALATHEPWNSGLGGIGCLIGPPFAMRGCGPQTRRFGKQLQRLFHGRMLSRRPGNPLPFNVPSTKGISTFLAKTLGPLW